MSDKKPALHITEGDFCFQGLTLRYKEWNAELCSDISTPVIALHGWMDNAASFDILVPRLAQSRTIALDFSGHGLSDRRSVDADYYIWVYVEEILALLNHLNIKSCVLLGHSMGAAVASLFAALYPEKVKALIMLDMLGPISTEAKKLPAQMRKAINNKELIKGLSITHYPSLQLAQQARANRGTFWFGPF